MSHVVHIGYHKTATTWLQQLYFPALEGVRMVPRPAIIQALLEPDAFRFDPAEARSRLGLEPNRRTLISMEALSGYLHHGGYQGHVSRAIAERLRETLGADTDILVVLRRQPDVLAACYAQYVRAGGTHSIDRYLFPESYLKPQRCRPDKIPRFRVAHFDYRPLLQHYRNLFGSDRVHVFVYEHLREDPAAWLRQLESRLDWHAGPLTRSSRRNRSYGPLQLTIARWLNHLTAEAVLDKRHWLHVPGWYLLTRGLLTLSNRALPAPTVGKPALPSRLRQRIDTYYAQSNAALATEWGLPLERYAYPLPGAQSLLGAARSEASAPAPTPAVGQQGAS